MCGMEPAVRSRRPLPQHSEAFAGSALGEIFAKLLPHGD